VFIIFFGLGFITQHNNYVKVPRLFGLDISKAVQSAKSKSLSIIILDSAKFNPNYPPLTVLDQFPDYDKQVKKGRKIYLTLNPVGYKKMKVPNIIQITLRNAETLLNAVGFEVGELIYKDNIGKDMVLEIRHEGKKINPGHSLQQRKKIDLVLGNGKK
jgi:beta-lactam-binding protein with PASTA domain